MPRHARLGRYSLVRTLGEGSYGKVKLARDAASGEEFAVKVVDKRRVVVDRLKAQVTKEIRALRLVEHPSVVRVHEVLVSARKIYIVMELVAGGALYDRLLREERFDEETARGYFRQLLEGVRYCHRRGVFHRDLKPENLLLDAAGALKISDFGLSAIQEEAAPEGMLRTTCGTPNYMAPEVLTTDEYEGGPADVWSMGVVLFVMLAGFLPFDEETHVELFRAIVRGEVAFPDWFPPGAVALLRRVFVPDPAARASLDEIAAHEWYRAGDGGGGGGDGAAGGAPAGSDAPQAASVVFLEGGSASETSSDGGEEEEEEEEDDDGGAPAPAGDEKKEEEASPRRRVSVNAFGVINMMGFSSVNRMFLSGADSQPTAVFVQLSADLSVAEQLGLVARFLDRHGARYRESDTECSIGATLPRGSPAPADELRAVFQLYEYKVSPPVHVVGCQREGGSPAAFAELADALRAELPRDEAALLASRRG